MKKFKWMIALIVVLLLTAMFSMTAFATNTGNVAGAVEGTWKAASSQIKTVVNNVVFPAIDHRKHGQIEWAPAAILFAGLVFSLFAPMYVWQIVGI